MMLDYGAAHSPTTPSEKDYSIANHADHIIFLVTRLDMSEFNLDGAQIYNEMN